MSCSSSVLFSLLLIMIRSYYYYFLCFFLFVLLYLSFLFLLVLISEVLPSVLLLKICSTIVKTGKQVSREVKIPLPHIISYYRILAFLFFTARQTLLFLDFPVQRQIKLVSPKLKNKMGKNHDLLTSCCISTCCNNSIWSSSICVQCGQCGQLIIQYDTTKQPCHKNIILSFHQ